MGGIVCDVPDFLGVGQHPAEQADGADCCGWTSSYPSKAPGFRLHRGGSLAARDSFKEALHIGAGEVPERFFAE